MSQISHNVPPEVCWMPEDAAAHFLDDPNAYIYVALVDNGGMGHLHDLLVELDVIDAVGKGIALS